MDWKKISFDEITEYSDTPEKLSRSSDIRKKTSESIVREFDIEKWGPLVKISKEISWSDHERLNQELHYGLENKLCLMDNQIYLASAYEISRSYVERSVSILSEIYLRNNCNCIVELAAGYGRLLVPLTKALSGYEIKKVCALDFTKSSLEIINNIWDRSICPLELAKVDLSDSSVEENVSMKSVEEDLKPLVFSSQGIMYVPKVSENFLSLTYSWPSGIFCFLEPSISETSVSRLKPLQEKYIEINDYNTNLGNFLRDSQSKHKIKNLNQDDDLISENAFLPLRRFSWEFN